MHLACVCEATCLFPGTVKNSMVFISRALSSDLKLQSTAMDKTLGTAFLIG